MGMIGNAPYGGVIGTGNILNSAITADKLSSTAIQDKLGFIPQSANDVATAVANLVSSAPSTLNTLDELAAALGDDANFATTIANSLGLKANTVDVNTALALKANQSTTYTKTETDSLLSAKQNSLGYTPVNKAGDTMTGYGQILTLSTSASAGYNYMMFASHAGAGDPKGFIGYGSSDDGMHLFNYKSARLSLGTTGQERLRVYPNGEVVRLNQPAFQTYNQSPSTPTNTKTTLIAAALLNTGSCYNTSNGRFTAPVAGNYMFWLSVTPSSAAGSPAVYFMLNGGGTQYGITLAYSASYNASTSVCIIPMGAGDYVQGIIEEWNGSALSIWNASMGGYLT